jgi:hypothetical protein
MPIKIDDRVYKGKPQKNLQEVQLSSVKEFSEKGAKLASLSTEAELAPVLPHTAQRMPVEPSISDDTSPENAAETADTEHAVAISPITQPTSPPQPKKKTAHSAKKKRKAEKPLVWGMWNLVMAILALVLLLTSLGILGYYAWRYSQIEQDIPLGVTLGGIPVGGLSRNQATARLEQVYLTPIVLRYHSQEFQLSPAQVQFSVNLEQMVSQLPQVGNTVSFWDYLWGKRPVLNMDVSLIANYSQTALREYLQDVASRYDTPILSAFADPRSFITYRSTAGEELQQATAVPLIHAALFSPSQRTIDLPIQQANETPITLEMLDQQLRTYLLDELGFQGLVNLYMMDLKTHTPYHLTLFEGKDLLNKPDIAVSGMSIMKITILTEFYRQLPDGAALPSELDLVEKSITKSSNYTSNLLINWIGDLDDNRGLYVLNQTLTRLGLENTFMGGLYDSFEPPGFRFTPANQRTDINTVPDAYMQTTASDMGKLLQGIYDCATTADGLLIETFGSEFTPKECNAMLDWLSANKIAVLTEAGAPAGTRIAHKHGWADGEPIGDAAIVFTPNADYVFVCYIWVPEYTYWEENSKIMENISKAVYYHFNPQ